jgi:hypothetical protein
LEASVTAAIALEDGARLVVGAAVELDDHARFAPNGVDFDPLAAYLQPDVGLWARQARPVHQGQEAPLQVALGGLRTQRPCLQCCPQLRGPRAALVARYQGNQGSRVGQPQRLSSFERPVELVELEDRGEVEQRAGDGGDGDAGLDGAFVGGDGRFADPDPFA